MYIRTYARLFIYFSIIQSFFSCAIEFSTSRMYDNNNNIRTTLVNQCNCYYLKIYDFVTGLFSPSSALTTTTGYNPPDRLVYLHAFLRIHACVVSVIHEIPAGITPRTSRTAQQKPLYFTSVFLVAVAPYAMFYCAWRLRVGAEDSYVNQIRERG